MEKIQTLWVKGELTEMEKMSLKSFSKNGHEVHIYTYKDVDGIPNCVSEKDGRQIVPEEEIFTYKSGGFGEGSFSGFADLFRLKLLNQKGGWWVDTDVVCLRPFSFDRERVVATSYEYEWGKSAINCVMKFPPKDPILEYCISCFDSLDKEEVEFGETGPNLLQSAIRKLESEEILASPKTFCPIGWRDVEYIVSSGIYRHAVNLKRKFENKFTAEITSEAYSVHLWNQFWVEKDLKNSGSFPSRSIYEKLRKKYIE